MRRLPAGAALLFVAIGVAAGCAIGDPGSARGEPEIRELERRAVGRAVPYPADAYGDTDAERYAASKRARRELGWHVLAKALKPVAIAAQPVATPAPSVTRTLPLFRTWLGGDEFERLFGKMYTDLGPERRRARDVPSDAEVDALFDWNATSLGPSSEADYFARLEKLGGQPTIDGLGGNARVAYSPAYVKQYLNDYPAIEGCKDQLAAFSFETPPRSDANFTRCFSRELPPDAAVIKASWRRNDAIVPDGLPVLDTSAAALAPRVSGAVDKGGWNLRVAPHAAAGPAEAYTVTLSDDATYALVGLHLMTKELRHWVWVTVWWSPDGSTDFGADRPEEITKLGAPWDHYKMCVVTDFEEKDPDPRGGFEGLLGDALAAVHGQTSWCSNGFIERGDHNAQTNCIGCHQHAGDIGALDCVLVDEATFPAEGRTLLRKSFPADYSWAFATPASPDQKDRLLDVITKRMQAFEPGP